MRELSVLVAHPSADLYGSDRVVIETVRALRDAGHRVVFTVPADGPLSSHITALGVPVVFCPTPVLRKAALRPCGLLALLRTTIRATRPALRLLYDHAVDVVVVNTVTIPWWLVLSHWPRQRRRTLVHVHEAERSAPSWAQRALAAPLRLADVVAANSRFSRDVLADVSPRLGARIEILANPVLGPKEIVDPRIELRGPLQLVFVGRLSPRKGPDVAIAAVERLARAGVEAQLNVIGAVFPGYEWFEAQLRSQVAAAGLANHVKFAGFDADVWPHLAAADIVLVPSTVDEPFGNTAVEALLAGRPVVVSATSGLLEAAAGYDAAVFVEPGDPAAIADTVFDLRTRWPDFRTGALADAERAALRHDPAAYRRRLAELVGRAEPSNA